MKRLVLNAEREAYDIGQIRETMTTGELIRLLEEYDEDTPIYLSHDNGYTYGAVLERRFDEVWEE
ncbi:MAG: hypothetical protein IJ849_05980 [Selenomonadaceae bacterium]|nr:hypothetical protein [Selenomonadaceae bacterium]